MPVSTVSMGAGSSSLLHSHKAAQPLHAGIASGTVSKTAAAGQGELLAAPAVKTAAEAKTQEIEKSSAKQVAQSLDDINKVLSSFSISVQFQVDPDYKELIVKVVDQDTGKLIRQIPTEDVVKMSKAMDSLKGLLFAQSA